MISYETLTFITYSCELGTFDQLWVAPVYYQIECTFWSRR